MNEKLWQPSEAQKKASNLWRFMQAVNKAHGLCLHEYAQLHQWSVESPADFWASLWQFMDVIAHQPWQSVLRDGDAMPGASWFDGAQLNFAENLLRYRDDRVALVCRDETDARREITYAQLAALVQQLQSSLRQCGVEPGDRVAGFLTNGPETVIAMLATASLGAVWTSCSPDFGLSSVMERFGQVTPKVLIAIDGYHYKGKIYDALPTVKALVEGIESLEKTVIVPYVSEGTGLVSNAVLWDDFLQQGDAGQPLTFAYKPFQHPLAILYSSGTTGKPKCIVHGAGGTLLQHMKELALHTDLKREDTLFFYTTCGWMMWNWMVSGLAVGATLVLYDGAPVYPRMDSLFDLIDEESVSVFGTSAKYLSAIEKAGVKPVSSHQLTALRSILSTASPLLPESFDYVYRDIKADSCLSSISGGSDIISCFMLGNPLLPVYRGELQCLGLGMDVAVFDEQGQAVVGEKGELVCRKPFVSMPLGFWNDTDDRLLHKAYFAQHANCWTHGDYAELMATGGAMIFGRSDAVLNPGGIRIGTAEIYRQVDKIDAVVDSVVVGKMSAGDQKVVLFVVLREAVLLDDALTNAIKTMIRQHATARHVPSCIIQAPDVPRTRNGKLAELAVQQTINHLPVKNRDALANPASLDFFADHPALAEL